MNRTATIFISATATIAALALAGCAEASSSAGDTSPASSSQAAAFNDQDVVFTQMMLPHHTQAVEMSDMLLAKDGIDGDVTALAETIKAEQAPEIDQLTTWLKARGQDTEASMDHSMDGMMSDSDMDALEDADGTDAARLFLEQMTAHHEGAVEMAQTEIDGGQNPAAVQLATAIVASQTDQIATMKDLLASTD
ncbi:uncharacterized protein (DUF305 family) [Frigoribacterium sp. PhB160]|uniref:DUF305 domain-containing protein n=1 Tax=Frigoribacterium sp. PhB160 TaxID=2485192 RepID=UPI000F47D3FE|nr:DUF305 domain-containing protein [Frigoribacterium sp. PhB160]ROS58248.1 uncharacterized protein (DUF305 family) [Frigoribacterium sp. PhB160]